MAPQDTAASWLASEIATVTADAWRVGRDERRGGNVPSRPLDRDVEPHLADRRESRIIPLEEPLPALADDFLVADTDGPWWRARHKGCIPFRHAADTKINIALRARRTAVS